MYDEETLNEILDNDRKEFEAEIDSIQAEIDAEADEAREKAEAAHWKKLDDIKAVFKLQVETVNPTNHLDIAVFTIDELYVMAFALKCKVNDPYPKTTAKIIEKLLEQVAYKEAMED